MNLNITHFDGPCYLLSLSSHVAFTVVSCFFIFSFSGVNFSASIFFFAVRKLSEGLLSITVDKSQNVAHIKYLAY